MAHIIDEKEQCTCPQCGTVTTHTAVIRYGGICGSCWHENDQDRKEKKADENKQGDILNCTVFNPIYDSIRDISIAVDVLFFYKMADSTKERYERVMELAAQLQDAAHELHEHLAWDDTEVLN